MSESETLALLLRRQPALRGRALALEPLEAPALLALCGRAGLPIGEAALRRACAELNVRLL